MPLLLVAYGRNRIVDTQDVECNWQNVSELGVFRVVETVTLEMDNRLWSRDLCATPYVSS